MAWNEGFPVPEDEEIAGEGEPEAASEEFTDVPHEDAPVEHPEVNETTE